MARPVSESRYPQGWIYDPVGQEQYLIALSRDYQLDPYFGSAARELVTAVYGEEPPMLYRALTKVLPAWKSHKQDIGDCVSHGWSLGVDTLAAVQIVLDNKPEDWFAEAASEAIYGGSRVEALGRSSGGWGDGSNGSWAARWVSGQCKGGKGGVLYRTKYGDVDLSSYSGKRAKDWGNYGVPDGLEPTAAQHPVKTVALVTSFEEAVAAIRSGYPVPVCSGQGFTSKRDADGFAKAAGSWAHCMLFWAARLGSRPGLLCQNSWGSNWISGPKWPDDQPDGSFWVEADVATRMLRGRDSFAISNLVGYPRRLIDWANVWK